MIDEADSQELAFVDSWNRWLSPEASYSQGAILDPGAPIPVASPSLGASASPDVHVEPDRLCFLQLDEWEKEKDYNVEPPICIRYTIVWKVKFNNRTVLKDTEQDVVLAPASYWTLFLQQKLDALLSKKQTAHNRMKADDSNIIVSVNQRSEQNLERRFDETNVDWSAVGKRLLHWGEPLCSGKKLGVEVSFDYVEA